MESFEERRNEYFKKLRNNNELLLKLSENKTNDPKSMEVLLMPKTERELEVAEAMITFMNDAIDLFNNAIYGNVERIDLENSLALNCISEIILSLKNNDNKKLDSIKNYLDREISSKDEARLLYEFISAFSMDCEAAIDFLARKTGFDMNDTLSIIQFQMYLEKAKEFTNNNSAQIKLSDVDIETSEEVTKALDFINEFHNCCEKGFVKNQNDLKMRLDYLF